MTQLSNYIAARNKILIKNKHELITSSSKDNFHIVMYYVNAHKIEIIIRKLNMDNGWTFDLKVKLFNLENNDHQVISVGSCDENYKILEIYSKFKIDKKQQKNLVNIPKRIIQTNKSICSNIYHYNSVMTFLEKNPEYEYYFFNDYESRQFIKEHFVKHIVNENNVNEIPDVLTAYDMIIPGAIKADLFRYCYLYIYGGVYVDSKISTYVHLDDIIDENDKYIFVKDDAPKSIYNGFMITEKENKNLLKVIKELITNVLKKDHLNDIHRPTGNKLLYTHFKDYTFKLSKQRNLIKLNNTTLFDCIYTNYYQESYNDFRINYHKNNYYYKYVIYTQNDYIFMFYNYDHQDKFNVFNLKNGIFVIKRVDEEVGWGMTIKMTIFDPILKRYIDKQIEPNKENECVFSV